MTDLDADVAALKARITAAQRARARAEAERDSAAAQADTIRRQLAEEFGVSTVEDARAALTRLENTQQAEIARLRAALDEAGV